MQERLKLWKALNVKKPYLRLVPAAIQSTSSPTLFAQATEMTEMITTEVQEITKQVQAKVHTHVNKVHERFHAFAGVRAKTHGRRGIHSLTLPHQSLAKGAFVRRCEDLNCARPQSRLSRFKRYLLDRASRCESYWRNHPHQDSRIHT